MFVLAISAILADACDWNVHGVKCWHLIGLRVRAARRSALKEGLASQSRHRTGLFLSGIFGWNKERYDFNSFHSIGVNGSVYGT